MCVFFTTHYNIIISPYRIVVKQFRFWKFLAFLETLHYRFRIIIWYCIIYVSTDEGCPCLIVSLLFRILVGVSAASTNVYIKTNNNRCLIDFTVILPWACWNLKSGRRENSRIKNKIKNYAIDDDDSYRHCTALYYIKMCNLLRHYYTYYYIDAILIYTFILFRIREDIIILYRIERSYNAVDSC